MLLLPLPTAADLFSLSNELCRDAQIVAYVSLQGTRRQLGWCRVTVAG